MRFARGAVRPEPSSEKGLGSLAEDLKAVYQAGTEKEAKKVLKKLRGGWETCFPRIVACWETKASALLAFLRHPRAIRQYLELVGANELGDGAANECGVGESTCEIAMPGA
ncbi:MAG: transposase [Candidatus Hadarchaeum sp.]